MLSDFAKVFERKVWPVQLAHLHNVVCALSSLSRCFQFSKNLDKDSFRCLWYCGKEQIECRLVSHWSNSTDLGLIYMFFTNQNAEIVACILSFRKSRHKQNLESTSKYVFSPTWRKFTAFWVCACKLSWTLFSPAWVQPLYGAGRKESSGTGLRWTKIRENIELRTVYDESEVKFIWHICTLALLAMFSAAKDSRLQMIPSPEMFSNWIANDVQCGPQMILAENKEWHGVCNWFPGFFFLFNYLFIYFQQCNGKLNTIQGNMYSQRTP